MTVQLKDSAGDLLATTVTDRQGRYSFDQLTGVAGTGTYTVSIVVPYGFTETSSKPVSDSVEITKGGLIVAGVNFTLTPAKKGPAPHANPKPPPNGWSAQDTAAIDAIFAQMNGVGGGKQLLGR